MIMKRDFFKGIKEDYSKCFKFIKSSKNFIYLGIIIFFAFAIFGLFVNLPVEISNQILDYFKELVEKTKDYGAGEMISFIFLNNLQASFFGMILGVFIGIFPLINLFGNGFVLGFAAKLAIAQEGVGSLWRILPHGIFELPAIFIALGLGMRLGTFVSEKKGKKWKTLKINFKESLRTFVLVILPLLIVAAIIEGLLIVLS
jgi:stage II sporulation protein M